MAIGATISQRSGLVFGLLSLTSGQTKPLTDGVFAKTTTPPNACRGVTIKLRSGAAKLVDKLDATDGFTLAVGVAFGDETASDLEGWWIKETAAGSAEVEIICRTGGAS